MPGAPATGHAAVSTEAEARAALIAESASWDMQTPSWWEALNAYRDAILAAERERTAALVEAARAVGDFAWHGATCPARFGADRQCICGVDKLRAALRAYEEGVSK